MTNSKSPYTGTTQTQQAAYVITAQNYNKGDSQENVFMSWNIQLYKMFNKLNHLNTTTTNENSFRTAYRIQLCCLNVYIMPTQIDM